MDRFISNPHNPLSRLGGAEHGLEETKQGAGFAKPPWMARGFEKGGRGANTLQSRVLESLVAHAASLRCGQEIRCYHEGESRGVESPGLPGLLADASQIAIKGTKERLL